MGHAQSKPTSKTNDIIMEANSYQTNKKIMNSLVTVNSCDSFITSNNCKKFIPSITAETCSKFIPKCPAPSPCPQSICPSPSPCPICSTSKICAESSPCPVCSSNQNTKSTVNISDLKKIINSDIKITPAVTPVVSSSVVSSSVVSSSVVSNATKNAIPYVVISRLADASISNLADKKCIYVDNNLKININKCDTTQPNSITWLTKKSTIGNNTNLIHMASGKCLDISDNAIHLNICDDKNIFQQWQILENHNSVTFKQNTISKCLDSDNTNIVLNACTGNNSQSWIMTK